jgi:hypothetical protein
LDLFANAADHNGRRFRRGGLGHRLVTALHRIEYLRPGPGRYPQFLEAGYHVPVRAADRVAEQLEQAALHTFRYHVLPAARLDVHLFPGQFDDANEKAFGQPVLAHHPGGERPADIAERQLAVTGHVQQPVPLHPGHGLAHGRPALREPLGDTGTERDDSLLFELEDSAEVHLCRVDKPMGGQLLILLL